MATTTEKSIKAAAGLGDANPSEVLAGATFSSETGFNQTGTYVPSAAATTYDSTASKLGADDVQAAIDALANKTAANKKSLDDLAGSQNTDHAALENHTGDKNNPHGVTAAQVGLGNVNNTADKDKNVKYATGAGSATKAAQDADGNVITSTYAKATNLTDHTSDKSNPHGVTAAQVGLGNVPNVTTNNQTPTYTAKSELEQLLSGEKLSAALGKLAAAVSSLIEHLANKNNPHEVTKEQLDLERVENTLDKDKEVKYAEDSKNAENATYDSEGNVISMHYAKQEEFMAHLLDDNPHGLSSIENTTRITQESLNEHKSDKNNPHGITMEHLGVYEVAGTLTAGTTSLVLRHSNLTTDSTIEIYTSVYGVNPELVDITGAPEIVLAFPETLEIDLGVKVRFW